MQSRIEFIQPRLLAGMSLEMSINSDRTSELWLSFKSKMGTIKNRVDDKIYNLKRFHPERSFSDDTLFEKWAAVEIDPA